MADHIAMYRRNGITKLYSFDTDENVVLRQRFNAPTHETKCEVHAAEELPAYLDNISDDLNIDHLICWLDYTGTGSRGAQLADYQALLQRLGVGDVARIALDASLPAERLKAELPEALRDQQLPAMNELLARELGAYHPEDVVLGSLNDMPRYLSTCLQHLCDRASANHPIDGAQFRPMLQTYYVDSSPMFTATILVQNGQGEPQPPEGFAYLANGWQDIEFLEVPELTAREKSFLDRLLDQDTEALTAELGYDIARAAQVPRQWTSFKKFHRFLPQFQHVELK
nr:O-methyltransferase [Phaeobacter inhibens]